MRRHHESRLALPPVSRTTTSVARFLSRCAFLWWTKPQVMPRRERAITKNNHTTGGGFKRPLVPPPLFHRLTPLSKLRKPSV
jgi:hypothetical protein